MKWIISFLFLLNTSISFSQDDTIVKDTVSGFYLTKSFEGFTGENFETLVLEDKPYIYITELKYVSQEFNFRNQPVVNMVFDEQGKGKLKNIAVKFKGQPLVIVLEKKIIMAPTLMGL